MSEIKTQWSTLMVETETRDNLKILAAANKRSMASQISWMVEKELREMQRVEQENPTKSRSKEK